MKLSDFIVDLFKDERKSISIKPVLAFLGSCFLFFALIRCVIKGCSNSFPDELINSISFIIITCLSADTADKFSIKNKNQE